jgi:hypothetical protein
MLPHVVRPWLPAWLPQYLPRRASNRRHVRLGDGRDEQLAGAVLMRGLPDRPAVGTDASRSLHVVLRDRLRRLLSGALGRTYPARPG